MSELFWLGKAWFEAGAILRPQWGPTIAGLGGRHPNFGREMVLELCRREVAPHMPSRLTSMFGFPSPAEAHQWTRNENILRDWPLMYRVVPEDPDTKQALVNMSTIDGWERLRWADEVKPWAKSYWTDPPVGGIGEILVEGRLRIMEFVADLRFPG